MALSKTSRARLSAVHPDLRRVIEAAAEATTVPFVVTEGIRSLTRQKELLAAGASTTLRSRHLTGHAVDLAALVGGKVRWDWPLYDRLGEIVKDAARGLKIPVEWGGDWLKFRDGPHFQLPWKEYPLSNPQ